MLNAIIQSNIRPAILIPILEEMIAMEQLLQSEHIRNNNDIECINSEIRITQLDMLLHVVIFKTSAP
jgi:hypothetical protein